jgi:hypothetical protein
MIRGSYPIFALSNHTACSQTQTGATVPLKKVFKKFSRFVLQFLYDKKRLPILQKTRCFERGARCQTLSTPLYFSVWVVGKFFSEKDPGKSKKLQYAEFVHEV